MCKRGCEGVLFFLYFLRGLGLIKKPQNLLLIGERLSDFDFFVREW